MTDYGPTDQITMTAACEHCWHTDTTSTFTYTSYPPATPRVCCHCGLRELYRPPLPPIPDGHGPYYPRQQPYTVTFPSYSNTYAEQCACNPKNGGSGVCNCTLGGTTITNHG